MLIKVFAIALLPVLLTLATLRIQRLKFTFPTEVLVTTMIINVSVIIYAFSLNRKQIYWFCKNFKNIKKNDVYNYLSSEIKYHQYPMSTFSMAKHISIYIFSGFISLYISYHLWIHTESYMSICMNISILLYLVYLFFRFFLFCERKNNNIWCELVLSILISLASTFDFFIPLLESTYVSNCGENITSAEQNLNHTSNTDILVLESIDPFLVPGIVGFTLLTFEYETLSSFGTNQNKKTNNEYNSQMDTAYIEKIKIYLVHHIFFMIVFALFCFILTQKLKDFFIIDSTLEILIYVRFSLKVIECISFLKMFWKLKSSFCSWMKKIRSNFVSSLDISVATFFVAFIFHLLLHIFVIIYCEENGIFAISIIGLFMIIFVDIPQAIFIFYILLYSSDCDSEHRNIQSNELILNLTTSVCGFLNMGLWISDSIVIDWINTSLFCKTRNESLIGFLNVVVYFTIFYHYQTGLAFLKLYWLGNMGDFEINLNHNGYIEL